MLLNADILSYIYLSYIIIVIYSEINHKISKKYIKIIFCFEQRGYDLFDPKSHGILLETSPDAYFLSILYNFSFDKLIKMCFMFIYRVFVNICDESFDSCQLLRGYLS